MEREQIVADKLMGVRRLKDFTDKQIADALIELRAEEHRRDMEVSELQDLYMEAFITGRMRNRKGIKEMDRGELLKEIERWTEFPAAEDTEVKERFLLEAFQGSMDFGVKEYEDENRI